MSGWLYRKRTLIVSLTNSFVDRRLVTFCKSHTSKLAYSYQYTRANFLVHILKLLWSSMQS